MKRREKIREERKIKERELLKKVMSRAEEERKVKSSDHSSLDNQRKSVEFNQDIYLR